jgi:serine/threonine protein kinase/type II secretory pathway pseudopilin PulG
VNPGEHASRGLPDVRALFDELVVLPAPERTTRVAALRDTDPAIADELAELLAASDTGEGVLASTSVPAQFAHNALAATLIAKPVKVGKYTPVRVLGEGGMGVVYEATQDTPRRTVALKLIRPEMVTPAMLRRFAHEAEVLAHLQHPCIAQLFDADLMDARFEDAPPGGQFRRIPAIAMELVAGESITLVARRENWPIHAIARVFARACDGVDHAHKRGVIHRDLKPANILIERADADPKILDFGIARLTAGATDAPQHTIVTHAGQMIGTLAYMSPEQASGDATAIDIRTDVYALGVTLFELLAGQRPIDLQGLNITQAAVAIRDRVAPRLRALRQDVPMDLEAIAAKAIEKQPADRYQSAGELAEDLRRFLADEPVLARQQTSFYRARKFASRNKGTVAALAAIALAIVLGLAGTAWQAVIATRERNQAQEQAARAQATIDFMRKMSAAATPLGSQGKTITVRQMLDTAVNDLSAPATGDALPANVRADLEAIFAEMYLNVSDYAKARDLAQRANEYLAIAQPADERTTRLQRVLALAHNQTGTHDEAERLLREALATHRARHPGDNDTTVDLLGALATVVSENSRRIDERVDLLREGHAMCLRLHGTDHRLSIQFSISLGQSIVRQHLLTRQPSPTGASAQANANTPARQPVDPEEGIRMLVSAREASERVLSEDHPVRLVGSLQLAAVQQALYKDGRSIPLLTELLPRFERTFGENHESTLTTLEELANAHSVSGDLSTALALEDAYRGAGDAPSAARVGAFVSAKTREKLNQAP